MRTARFALALFACTALTVHAAQAQVQASTGTIDGVVTDTMLVPIMGATVSVIGSNIRVVTGDNGRFRIGSLQPGEYIVIAHRLGYDPLSTHVEVTVADTARVSF